MLGKALIGCAALLWAGGAQAEIRTFTQSGSYSNREGSYPGMAMFSHSWGDLLNVHFEVQVIVPALNDVTLYNYSAEPVTVTLTNEGTWAAALRQREDPLAYGFGNEVAWLQGTISDVRTVTVAPGKTVSTGGGIGFGSTDIVDLSPFIGAGTLWLDAGGDVWASYSPLGALWEMGSGGHGGMLLGTAKLTYTYDSAHAVPEPATWMMMIAGFGFVGAALRRRQKVALA